MWHSLDDPMISRFDTILAHLDEQFLQFSGLGFVTLGLFYCA